MIQQPEGTDADLRSHQWSWDVLLPLLLLHVSVWLGPLHIKSQFQRQYGVTEQVEDLVTPDQWHPVLYHHVQQHAWGRPHSASSQFESAPLWWRTAWGGR